MSRTILIPLFVLFPAALFAESAMPSTRFTGAPSDGGQNCSTCHNSFGGANSDPTGSLSVDIDSYNPGVQQMIHITVKHPAATRWGFQINIRSISDETIAVGDFSSLDATVKVRCDDGSQFGSAPPCDNLRQFAEHADAPSMTGGSFTFLVPWTPPINEIGDLSVYVSAVAANGDKTAAGDRVYTLARRISFVGACSLPEKKATIRTAVNGASFQPAFSSKSMLTIFGSGFQNASRIRSVGLGDITNNSFPTVLSCVAVEMSGPSLPGPVRLPIAYIQQDQINVQAPVFPVAGPVSLVVILNADKPNVLRSDVSTLTALQPIAPAFFIYPTSTSIAATFANSSVPVANPSVVAGGKPAKPGDIVTLWATGFGETNPSVPPGQLASGAANVTGLVTVSMGGTTLAAQDVLYVGLSPGSISGLYQINLRVPQGTPDGDIAVVASTGGSQTQTSVTIPVQH